MKIQEGKEEDLLPPIKMRNISRVTVGVDEVGRGALFGPVFAGAVELNKEEGVELIKSGLKDSKLLTAKKRSQLIPLIKKLANAWALGQSSAKEIDRFGIRSATEMAMLRALQKMHESPDLVLVDGALPLRLWEGPQKTLIKGESKSPAIAAASVLAKEARDLLIKRLSLRYPDFGLEHHVGYGTKVHKTALNKLGPTPLHRKSFLSKFSQVQ